MFFTDTNDFKNQTLSPKNEKNSRATCNICLPVAKWAGTLLHDKLVRFFSPIKPKLGFPFEFFGIQDRIPHERVNNVSGVDIDNQNWKKCEFFVDTTFLLCFTSKTSKTSKKCYTFSNF